MAEIDSTDDGRVDLKKRARRRLVGAVALALLAVIVLPMVMDEEPKPLTQDIQIRIPSQDSVPPVARAAAPVTPPPGDAKPAEPKADAKSEAQPAPASAVDAKPEAKGEPAKLVDAVKPAPAKAEPKAETKVEPKAEPKVEPKAEVKPTVKPVAEAKAAVKPDAKNEAKSEAKNDAKNDSEQWVVQLGAYQDPGNVKLLLAKVKELRLPAYTEKVDTEGGTRTRVRAGPFATREKAERAQAALKRIAAGGPSGGVVAKKDR